MRRVKSDCLGEFFGWLESQNPYVIQLWASETEDEFFDAAEHALEHTVSTMEAGARFYGKTNERALSKQLSDLLSAASIPTCAERCWNGHVDVTISHPVGERFTFLGECKIYDGFERHCKGCDQLLNRYSTGRNGRVFCLEFCKHRGMYDKLGKIRIRMDDERPLGQISSSKGHFISGAFITSHKHWSRATVAILHLGCNLFHPLERVEK